MKGAYFVRCDSCTGCCSGWHYCYVYTLGRYEWVKVFRCYAYGATYDKEAEQAEGFQKAAAEMTGQGILAISLPPGAKLTINGLATDVSNDALRRFQTPVLNAGQEATYEIAAEFFHEGRKITAKKHITVRAWQEAKVEITADSLVALAAK